MNMLDNIPQHKNCTNCGACCGVIPATQAEVKAIREYNGKHGIKPIKHSSKMICPFRDDKAKKCVIYAVRPTICRLMGVTKGMECPNGNTCEIQGDKFLPKTADEIAQSAVLNYVRW
jgi:Fe-S-cluster containining protein